MQLKWGTYPFDVNSASVATSHETRINDGGQPISQIRRYDVSGWLNADGQAAITAAMIAMQTALNIPYQDLVLYQDDGAASATLLRNAGSITGTKVTRGPHFRHSEGIEYVGTRQFEFTVEAEYPFLGTENALLSFRERLTFWGGGPTFTGRPAIRGPAQRQKVFESTPFEAEQQGEAVGYLQYPTASSPLWPLALRQVYPRKTIDSPRRRGSLVAPGYEGYPVSWHYSFVSVSPLLGVPNLWIA